MRIDSYIQVNQLYNTNKTKNKTKTEKSGTSDSLEISEFGAAYRAAKQAAGRGSDVREEKVSEIQAQMKAGTYRVTMEEVADKMADMLLS